MNATVGVLLEELHFILQEDTPETDPEVLDLVSKLKDSDPTAVHLAQWELWMKAESVLTAKLKAIGQAKPFPPNQDMLDKALDKTRTYFFKIVDTYDSTKRPFKTWVNSAAVGTRAKQMLDREYQAAMRQRSGGDVAGTIAKTQAAPTIKPRETQLTPEEKELGKEIVEYVKDLESAPAKLKSALRLRPSRKTGESAESQALKYIDVFFRRHGLSKSPTPVARLAREMGVNPKLLHQNMGRMNEYIIRSVGAGDPDKETKVKDFLLKTSRMGAYTPGTEPFLEKLKKLLERMRKLYAPASA